LGKTCRLSPAVKPASARLEAGFLLLGFGNADFPVFSHYPLDLPNTAES